MMFRPRTSSSKFQSPTSLSALTGALPSTFTDGLPLPSIFIFDLDYTLWPFWVDTHPSPPFKAMEGGSRVRDHYGESFCFYDDVGNILAALRQKSIKVAAASRTETPDLARDMLKLLRIPTKPISDPNQHAITWPNANSSASSSALSHSTAKAIDFFDHLQIYPGSKITHMEKIAQATGASFEEMLFFDDESRNREVEELGVVMWLVKDGVSNDEIDKGVLCWRKRNRRELQ